MMAHPSISAMVMPLARHSGENKSHLWNNITRRLFEDLSANFLGLFCRARSSQYTSTMLLVFEHHVSFHDESSLNGFILINKFRVDAISL